MVSYVHVVNLNQPSNLHGCQDMGLLTFWGHDVDLLGSRDVICHVTTGLHGNMWFPIGGQFEPSVLHGC